MIEVVGDRVGGSNVVLTGCELASWERLCFTLRIQDSWHLPSFHRLSDSLQYSRSDRRQLGVNLSRLDRIYVDDYFSDIGGEVGIIGGSLFSDHAPML